MGMFDEVKCSAPIGELTNVLTQTKDISDDYWEGVRCPSIGLTPPVICGQQITLGTYDFVFDGPRYPLSKN